MANDFITTFDAVHDQVTPEKVLAGIVHALKPGKIIIYFGFSVDEATSYKRTSIKRCDLGEAMTIARRGEMGLHQADCRLEYTRLFLAMGDKEKAREALAIAREMIGKMGYHRRDGEVKELEERLKS